MSRLVIHSSKSDDWHKVSNKWMELRLRWYLMRAHLTNPGPKVCSSFKGHFLGCCPGIWPLANDYQFNYFSVLVTDYILLK